MTADAAAPPALPALQLAGVHHVAIIASDYVRSRRFYTEVLGLRVVHEVFRAERHSHKLDLQLPDGSQIELFSFPNPAERPSYPEACGLRHLALRVADLSACVQVLAAHGVAVEPVRIDPFTGAEFTFLADPDGLPIELVGPAPAIS
jgi:glyoxylase I family protein